MKCILILTWFLSHGYSPPEAQGIVTNLYMESKCDSNSNNGIQIGIAQWQGPRKKSLIHFANQTYRTWTNLDMQLEFLDKEWKSISPNPRRGSQTGKLSASYFAIIFCTNFERPKSSCTARGPLTKIPMQ